MSNKDFSFAIKDCFLSVWIDETGGYGTFPLESMKTGVPVLGVVPNVMPYWLNTENGVWINNKIQITDFIADFLQNWLEDNIKETLYVEMDKTVQKLPTMESFENKAIELFNSYVDLRLSLFEEQLEKLKETEEYAN
jgi:glycosyltransferase involved in cell wall biosynthesis